MKFRKFVKNCHNRLPYEMDGCARLFLLSYFEYRQIWLNIILSDCHLRSSIKMQKEKLKSQASIPPLM
jgi:hypothetical protein